MQRTVLHAAADANRWAGEEAMSGPWTDGPRELLQHAADPLLGEDFDRRIATIR